MEERIRKQGSFSRTLYNEAKMGAYYTDPEHCEWISRFLQFPEEEVCCLDPSIGNGVALKIVTGKTEGDRKKLFGVELNRDTCAQLREGEPFLEELLEADFIDGVIVSHSAFSFCFMNPPYELQDGQRLENKFLGKVIPYLAKKAVIVLVVPMNVVKDPAFLQIWCRNFRTLYMYKFHPGEFEKYHQVVLFGRRKKPELDADDVRQMLEKSKELEVLPTDFRSEKIKVMSSKKEAVHTFLTKTFQPEMFVETVEASPLKKLMRERLKTEPYGTGSLERPPIMPCNNQLYLLAMCGGGEGLAGSEEGRDRHLQRGVIKSVENSSYSMSGDGKMIETVTQASKITFTIIEADGSIRELA